MANYVEDIYSRVQLSLGTENLSQTEVTTWLTSGTSKRRTLGTDVLALTIENKAIEEIELDIDEVRSFKELKELESEIKIPRLRNDIIAQREAIVERNKQVSFFKAQFEEEFNIATSLDELELIAEDAEDTAEQFGIIETDEIRRFSGKAFERNAQRFI